MLTQAQVDVLMRARARRLSVEQRLSEAWLAVKYRQYLNGGWTREDGTIAPPHKKAQGFHEACKDPEHHTFIIGGGRRSSKTFSAMSEFCAWVRYSRPWDKTPTCKPGLPRRWLIVAPNYSTAVPDVIEPYLDVRLGDIIVDRVRNQQKALVTAVLKDGSIIRINTFEQYLKIGREQTSVFQSGHFDGVLIDEVCPREVWIGIKRGLVTGRSRGWGKAIIAATPDKAEFGWVYDELYSVAHNKGGSDRGIWATEFSIYDNPSNTEEAIASLASGLLEEEREAIIHGRFRHLTGRVYKDYDETIHVTDWDCLVDTNGVATNWPIIHVVDPATRRPWVMGWFAKDPSGGLHLVREWPTADYEKMRDCSMDFADYARVIAEVEDTLPARTRDGREFTGRDRVLWRLMDPNYGATPMIAKKGLPYFRSLEEWGYFFDCDIIDDIHKGHLEVRGALKLPVPDRGRGPLNMPAFLVHAVPGHPLRNTRWSFGHYIYDEYRESTRVVKEKPLETGKDYMDLIRYALMKPTWFTDWTRRGESNRLRSSRMADRRARSRLV